MFEEFIEKTINKSIDIDNAYGAQCVDLFNYFNDLYNNGERINCLPSKYARSLAENKLNNGILKNFNETQVNNMIKGTVVVYGKCRYAPEGHVCFFIEDNGNGTFKALQQNDHNRKFVTIDNNPYEGIIGAFIPKQIQEEFNRKLEEKNNENVIINELKIGDKVISRKIGNASSYGNKITAKIGNIGIITNYIEGREYPYLISDDEGPLGWYKKEDLEKI